MRILVVPDKFKGTLTAQQAARAIAEGWKISRPQDTLELLPMSDGGDGFGTIMGDLLGAELRSAHTLNAAHEPIEASWWWSEREQTAVVESASIIGLAMLPAARRHPLALDTLGLGQLLVEIFTNYPGARLLIGIGGSATNDAGFGMARGLGFQFEDEEKRAILNWPELRCLRTIRKPARSFFSEVIVACDVQNPLMGPQGASRIYGPQKGLRQDDFSIADVAFGTLAERVRAQFGKDCSDNPGAGAAGGLGYGLKVFLEGVFRPGFDIFCAAAHLREKISGADLVITGEGAIDRQTAMGKGTGAVASLAKLQRKRCIALAGHVDDDVKGGLFDLARGMTQLTSPEEAKREAGKWLSHLSAEVARSWLSDSAASSPSA